MRDDNQPIYFSLNEHGGERTGLYLPCAFYDDWALPANTALRTAATTAVQRLFLGQEGPCTATAKLPFLVAVLLPSTTEAAWFGCDFLWCRTALPPS